MFKTFGKPIKLTMDSVIIRMRTHKLSQSIWRRKQATDKLATHMDTNLQEQEARLELAWHLAA